VKASEIKKGMIIKEDGELYSVIDMDHKTPGNLRAIYQATLKSLLNPKIVNKRYSPGDQVERVELDSKKVQYLFRDHSGYHFMDMETYDTLIITDEMVGSNKDYLKENLEVELLYHGHEALAVELPCSVELKVIESAPGTRGDTSGKAMKPAKLETGITVNVPLFIKDGDVLKIDTRTGEYLERA
jgi:elongation factor P